MNMLTPENLNDLKRDADVAENPTLKRLMKTWESKQARNARKAGGFGLMAVSLAACGGGDGDEPDPGEVLGNIFTLTTDADNSADMDPTGESDIEGDVFNAPLGVGIDGLVGVQTLQEADVIVGTDEVDVLNATLNGTGAGGIFAAPSITDVEVLNLTTSGSVLDLLPAGLDLTNSTGYTQIWNVGSSDDLTVVGINEAAAIGLDDVEGDTTYSLEFTSSADTSEIDIFANAVGASAGTSGPVMLDIDAGAAGGLGTVNLTVSNTVNLDLINQSDDMEIFTITGDGPLTIVTSDDQTPFGNLVELNSNFNTYTGDLTLDISGSDVLELVNTGVGDDFITIQDINADGGLEVNLGDGDDVLGLLDLTPVPANLNQIQILQGEEISGWDFTGGVSGVETLSVLTDVYLANSVIAGPVNPSDATLDLDGFDGDLTTVTFEAVYGNDNILALQNAPEALNIEAEMIDGLELDTGNIVDLTVNVNGDGAAKGFGAGDLGELDIDEVSGGSLETLTLTNTSTPGQASSDAGDIYLDIDSDTNHDVSALQSISVDASNDADVELDADDADADMSALTTINVMGGGDADLEMDGVPARAQEQEFVVDYDSVAPGGANFEFELLLPSGDTLILNRADFADQDTLDAALDGSGYTSDGLNTSSGQFSFTLASETPAAAAAIAVTDFSSTGLVNVDNSTEVTQDGIAPGSFLGMEEIVVEGGEQADVNLDDVHGMFTLDVTAEGVGEDGDDADVDVANTNVTSVNVTVSDATVYDTNSSGDVIGYVDEETGEAEVLITDDANENEPGNPSLTNLTASGAVADIELEGDLSSLTTIDLTGVTTEFDVDASGAEYAEGSNVLYMIGGTSSDWEDGDSSLTFGDGSVESVREVATFTEAEFGTVVINNFEASSADPNETDRIDLSDLGFSNEGQLDFEQGTYTNGVFTSGSTNSDTDIRITDGNLTDSAEMGGEIIVTDVLEFTGPPQDRDTVEDLQSNMVYV